MYISRDRHNLWLIVYTYIGMNVYVFFLLWLFIALRWKPDILIWSTCETTRRNVAFHLHFHAPLAHFPISPQFHSQF